MNRLTLVNQAWRELGPRQLGLYALYRLGLKSGYYHRTPTPETRALSIAPLWQWLNLPGKDLLKEYMGEPGVQGTLQQAEEIVDGKIRLFGGQPVPLHLKPPAPLLHWSAYEGKKHEIPGEDIKFTWEPARFAWAATLARAYQLTRNDRFPETFWLNVELFIGENPAYMGANWSSAQEAGLRLIALVFAYQVFALSPTTTPQRAAHLAHAVSLHAGRIPSTIIYARAQNNNHLLSEAAALYTAGICLPDHPRAEGWRESGWKWFNQGIQSQVDEDGTYIQHSANYQRLMLMIALWFNRLAALQEQTLPEATCQRLASATTWLLQLVNKDTGRAPNLGPNDGAYLLPLSSCEHQDYRPVLQAAGLAFLRERPYPDGPWDETAAWLEVKKPAQVKMQITPSPAPHILKNPVSHSYAYLRIANFKGRPGHADQLHLDLWWRNHNLARDPGTFLYNAAPPWDNSLTSTLVHNTIAINHQEQMQRAGRFLYLGWAQAVPVEGKRASDGSWQSLCARHTGYQRLGAIHQRKVSPLENGDWEIEDTVLPDKPDRQEKPQAYHIRLHWLLPDWSWKIFENGLQIESPSGWVSLQASLTSGTASQPVKIGLVRAGVPLYGTGPVEANLGWFSPTYGQKEPALSFFLAWRGILPLAIISHWKFPEL